jgi:hypothetical protein
MMARGSAATLAPVLEVTMAQAGVNPTLEGRALQDALLSAIADRRGYLNWDVYHVEWLVFLLHPEHETFDGRTFDETPAWCLVWLMAPEIGIGQFLL